MTAAPIDFVRLAAALLDRHHELLEDWLPGGRYEGHEYIGPSRRSGGIGDSLKVNTHTGAWGYFAGDDNDAGRDLISLYAWLNNLNNGQAARELMQHLGWQRSSEPPPVRTPAPRAAAAAAVPAEPAPARERWQSVLPVPPHANRPKRFISGFKNEKTGEWEDHEATRVWPYEKDGELFGWVARFERVNSDGELVKDTKAFTWCRDTHDERGGHRWHWKQWQAPRPLYLAAGLLSSTPADVPVVLVEGEKCAEAGHQLLGHEFDFVSWPGGSRAWALARWSWLQGRTVFMWPDCDAKRWPLSKAEREAGVDPSTKAIKPEHKQPGVMAMAGIGALLLAEHGCQVNLCRIPAPGDVPDGWDIADAIADGWDAARVREFIRKAVPFVPVDDAARAAAGMSGASAGASTPSRAAAGEGEGAEDDEPRAWVTHLLTTEKGATKAVRENVVLALDGWPERGVKGIPSCEGLIAFNQFSNNVEKRRETPWGTPAGDWLEADELLMGDWLVREQRMPSMPRTALEEAVLVVSRRHAFHPVRERMVATRGRWDGVKRLDSWLCRVCLEEDEWDERDPLVRYLALAGRWFVMGMCARVMPEKRHGTQVLVGPGTKFDYMLVFEGPQGWGKSTLAAVLGGDYYADTGLDINNKDSLMNIQGVLIYEWSELENLNRQEVGAVKRFISSPSDRFRATFDRRPAKYPRQVVFVGTTNEAHYLTDTTGNRRFWPVRVTRPPDLEWLRENLEQLLAEAVHRVDASERFWPTRDEQRELFDPQQSSRAVESSLEAAIRTYLYDEDQKVPMGASNGALIDQVTMQDLLGRVGYSIDKQTDAVVKKAGAVMHMLGWDVKRSSAPGRPRYYVRPKPQRPSGKASASTESAPAAPSEPVEADDVCPF